MFGTGLEIKAVIAIIVAVLLAGVAGVVAYEHHEVTALTVQTGADNAVIHVQTAAASEAAVTILNAGTSAQITDQVTLATRGIVAGDQTAQNQVVFKTQAAVAVVDKQYSLLPQTAANSALEDQAKGNIELNGVWATYCNTTVDPVNCPTAASGAVAASAPQ